MNSIKNLRAVFITLVAVGVILGATLDTFATGGTNLISLGQKAPEGASVKVIYNTDAGGTDFYRTLVNGKVDDVNVDCQIGQSFKPTAPFTLGGIAVKLGPAMTGTGGSGKPFNNTEGRSYKIHIVNMTNADDYQPDLDSNTIATFEGVIPAGFEDTLDDANGWIYFELPATVALSAGQYYGFLLEMLVVDSEPNSYGNIAASRGDDHPFDGHSIVRVNGAWENYKCDWCPGKIHFDFALVDEAYTPPVSDINVVKYGQYAPTGSGVKVSYDTGPGVTGYDRQWYSYTDAPEEMSVGQSFTPSSNFTLGAIAVKLGHPYHPQDDAGRSLNNTGGHSYKISIFTMPDADNYEPNLTDDIITTFEGVMPPGFEDTLSRNSDWVIFEPPLPTGVTFSTGQYYGFLFEMTDFAPICRGYMAFSRHAEIPFDGRGFIRVNDVWEEYKDWTSAKMHMSFAVIDANMNLNPPPVPDDNVSLTSSNYPPMGDGVRIINNANNSNYYLPHHYSMLSPVSERQMGQSFTPDANFALGAIAVKLGPAYSTTYATCTKPMYMTEGKPYKISLFTMTDANDYQPNLAGNTIASWEGVVHAGFESTLDPAWGWIVFGLPHNGQPGYQAVDLQAGHVYGYFIEWLYQNPIRIANISAASNGSHPYPGGRALVRENGSWIEYIDYDLNKMHCEFAVIDDSLQAYGCSPVLQYDFNKDCIVNFEDFAVFALDWCESGIQTEF